MVVTDVYAPSVEAILSAYPQVQVVGSTDELVASAIDVYAPCAMGGILSAATIPELRCAAVVGSANNQLADAASAGLLARAGVLYAPDFVINAGGLINVEDELRGYDRARAMQKVEQIYKQLQLIFAIGRERGISTAQAATEFAEERIRKISRIRLVRVTEYGPLSAHH